MTNTVINPTVGRVVWFKPGTGDPLCKDIVKLDDAEQPMAAIIARVHNPTRVNLTVFDPNGNPCPRRMVKLVQYGEVPLGNENVCTWMPFQVGQAARQLAEDVTRSVLGDNVPAHACDARPNESGSSHGTLGRSTGGDPENAGKPPEGG